MQVLVPVKNNSVVRMEIVIMTICWPVVKGLTRW